MSEQLQGAKIGATHAGGMLRLGFHEIQSAAALDSPIVQPNELGIYGTALPSEIAEVRRGDGPQLNTVNDLNPSLADRIRAIETQPAAPSRDDFELDKE